MKIGRSRSGAIERMIDKYHPMRDVGGGKYHDRFDRTRSLLRRLRKACEKWEPKTP